MISETELIMRLVTAIILGALIGLEREVHRSDAGLRTHILVCMGATLCAILSADFTNDPARVAAGVVTGLGFLGGGVIFKAQDHVKGLTTAADIWLLGAVGLAIGLGYYMAGISTVLLALLVLLVGRKLKLVVKSKK